jgi:tetratricopeptide (TPR) repeat protein
MYIDLDVAPTENVSMSVGELEKNLGSFQDETTRASAEKFLAQHFEGSKDYGKAIQYIEKALQNPAITAESKREYLGQLARMALLQKNYEKAASAIQSYLSAKQASGGSADADIYLLLAQVQYKRKNYVASADAMEKALALEKNPTPTQLKNALAIFYSTGSYDRAAQVMQKMVATDLNNADLWRQWTSLYLKAGKNALALDVMALAWEKGIPFRDQDILLLTDLYTINKIPGRGARVLEEAIATGRIKADSKINDRLFRLWIQAGERDKAQAALAKAASDSNDVELQLYLAQMSMEKEQWQAMQTQVLKACDGALPERLVSRANLLLGISQLKLGDTELARRSFINATIVGGAADAAQWLAFMKAAPATASEKVGIAGPCYSGDTRSIFAASMPKSQRGAVPAGSPSDAATTTATDVSASESAATESASGEDASEQTTVAIDTSAASQTTNDSSATPTSAYQALANIKGDPSAALTEKTTKPVRLYLGDYALTAEEMTSQIVPLATRLGITIVKEGAKITGPMYIIFPEPISPNGGKIKVRFGFPVTGNPKPQGRYQFVRDNGFKCVSRDYEGPPEGVAKAFAQLYADAIARGMKLSGESRQIASTDNVVGGKTVKLELQLGVQ